MPITASQSNVALSTIQTEYGGSNPVSLSEYYRGGVNVPNGPLPGASNTSGNITASVGAAQGTGNIPTSGAISINNFRPSSKTITVTVTVSANVTNLDLWSAITARLGTIGNVVNCTCTINAGVYVSSTSTGTAGLNTGSGWPAGSSLTVVNNGVIAGMGGAGGAGGTGALTGTGSAGSGGGPAMNLTLNTTVNNLGSMHGGGGGGGGGGAVGGSNYGAYSGGGGGGGGRSVQASSGGSNGSYSLWPAYSLLISPTNGGSGTDAGAGAGGVGAQQDSGGEGSTTATGGNGGAGGSYGAAGAQGSIGTTNDAGAIFPSLFNGGAGGAGGYYLVKNGFTVTWTNTGTRSGTEI